MAIRTLWLRGAAIAGVVAAATIIGVRETRVTALAKSPSAAPPGCPAVTKSPFSGVLAQSDGLKFQSVPGLPPSSIEVSSFQWGVGRGISSPTGGSGDRYGIGRGISSPTGGSADRESSAPSVSEIVVTKAADTNDPLLMQQAAEGNPATWTLWLYNTVGKSSAHACESIRLDNVFVSGFSIGSSGSEHPLELLSLNFSKLTVKNFSGNSDYVLDSPSTQ